MAGIDSPDGVCPVEARTGRRSSRRARPPPRLGAAVTPLSDQTRLACDLRLRRAKREIASGPTVSRP